ncbi:NADH-quinone oxidoreductase subunit L [Iodidimonas sp. SYSU 1G8]|uniref:NADH-quinone oxidoreductase subunit L n=1 Tax=Iodidimonas sp. SYSU 1G8 TaxID=3133967 RepID=UPI0031FF18A6
MYSLIVFLPLFAAIVAGFGGRWIGDRGAQIVTCGAVITSALLSVWAFSEIAMGHTVHHQVLAEWMLSGDFRINWAFKIDTLTAIMLVVVNVVSSIVHLYSIGYMSHDPHKPRFMAYLSLFTFAMLMLVTADNFVQMFFGWEGVGVASYLLIGFWYKKPSANAAAIKAFLVNRVGDFGFALGIFAVFLAFNSVEFETVFAAAPTMVNKSIEFLGYQFDLLTTITILLFIGAMGKSAQLGLHTWLPDAMEGPTPVSALIHAATMVTAGVFMVARCSPLFELAPTTLMVVTIIGASTAFFAATVGLVQNDIKRVIAYSTCSQLGYMFFALGVSAYGAAVFHLFTHAFFKALLFLGAGSVIHGMSNEQDMRKMGGVWKLMPITYAMMWIGSLALAGIPPFAGYFSKDMVLESAFAAGTSVGQYAYWMGIAAAFMTAFYSGRLLFMTFHGKPRASHEVMHHVHESPKIMLVPLVVLVAGAILSGLVFYEYFVGHHYAEFWGKALFVAGPNVLEAAHHVPAWVKYLPLVMGVAGLGLSWFFYVRRPDIPGSIAKTNAPLYRFLLNKWYFDELYDALFVRPAKWLGFQLWKKGDGKVIDGYGPDGVTAVIGFVARKARLLQTGYLYHYAFAMLIGVAGFVTWYMFRMGGGH